ncbi:MAG: FABP family protein [Bacteroidetes bacterium]|nr:FABP family protein [Bacteroidota bacterium]
MAEKIIDYGPLEALIGTWKGDKGTDIAPDPAGDENNPYYETIVFEAAGDVNNAKTQNLSVVRYQQTVQRKSNDEVFHNEVGYWLWDANSQMIMQSYTIPRGVCVIAGGFFEGEIKKDETDLFVAAAADDPDWGILEAPFMKLNAQTTKFEHSIKVNGNKMTYSELTVVKIYGTTFNHTDDNKLTKVE